MFRLDDLPNPYIIAEVGSCWRDFDEIKKYVNTFMKSGWSAASVVNQLHEYYITNDNFDTNFKNQISWLLFTTDSRLNNGTNEHIQLLNLLVKISQL